MVEGGAAMRKISSTLTFYYKTIFPSFWFGILALFLVVAFVKGAVLERGVPFIIIPILMGAAGYVLMKWIIWDLVDEVYDAGKLLVIKKGGHEYRVLLADITDVTAFTHITPPRITLRLTGASSTGPLGTEVAFLPVRSLLSPFSKSEVAEDLIRRVNRVRSERAETADRVKQSP